MNAARMTNLISTRDTDWNEKGRVLPLDPMPHAAKKWGGYPHASQSRSQIDQAPADPEKAKHQRWPKLSPQVPNPDNPVGRSGSANSRCLVRSNSQCIIANSVPSLGLPEKYSNWTGIRGFFVRTKLLPIRNRLSRRPQSATTGSQMCCRMQLGTEKNGTVTFCAKPYKGHSGKR